MTDDEDFEEVEEQGACGSCGHDPSCGYASVWTSDSGTTWLCHDDDHSCYVEIA